MNLSYEEACEFSIKTCPVHKDTDADASWSVTEFCVYGLLYFMGSWFFLMFLLHVK